MLDPIKHPVADIVGDTEQCLAGLWHRHFGFMQRCVLAIVLSLCLILKHPFFFAEPEKQFALLQEHIEKLRLQDPRRYSSLVRVYVERNLGFEAEHHMRALRHMPGVEFRVDHQAKRVGILTTNAIKHAMMTLTNSLLRERRLHIHPKFVSRDAKMVKTRLREQMEIYSYQYKEAATTFQKNQVALSGKVGGMKDDICIALQLACYFTDHDLKESLM